MSGFYNDGRSWGKGGRGGAPWDSSSSQSGHSFSSSASSYGHSMTSEGGKFSKGKGDFGKGKGKGQGKGKGKGKGTVTAETYTTHDLIMKKIEDWGIQVDTCGIFDLDSNLAKQRDAHEILKIAAPAKATDNSLDERRQVQVLLNYFPVQIATGNATYVYNVNFDPDDVISAHPKATKLRIYLVMKGLESTAMDTALVIYAGSSALFSASVIPQLTFPFSLREGGGGVVTLTLSKMLDWNRITPEHQFLIATVYQRGMRQLPNRVRVGRTTYDLTVREDLKLFNWNDPSFGPMRLIPGPIAKLVAATAGPMLVIDVSCRVKQEATVRDLLARGDRPQDLVGCMALVTYLRKAFVIHEITYDVKPSDQFNWKPKGQDERMISYAEYVKAKYGKHFAEHWQPDPRQAMVVELDRRHDQKNYYLAECIEPSGLSSRMKENHSFMSDLRQRVGGNPSWRAYLTQHLVLPSDDPTNAPFWRIVRGWGLTLTTAFTDITASIVPQPNIKFGDKQVSPGTDGKWAVFDVACRENRQMARHGGRCPGVVVFEEQNGREFFEEMSKKASLMGMQLNLRYRQLRRGASKEDYLNVIFEEVQQGAELACIAMPQKDERPFNLYQRIKNEVTLKAGVVTQCALVGFKSRDGAKAQMSAVQVCAKLGGIPWIPSSPDMPLGEGTLVLGIDLHHAKARHLSFAGFVAILDLKTMHFWQTVKENTQDASLIDTQVLVAVLDEVLEAFTALHNRHPRRVVVLRNGVGESQLLELGMKEGDAIKKELETRSRGITLTMLLTISDSKARVFALNSAQIGNPVPGTVIEGLRSAVGLDEFIMIPHGVTQGCVMPLKVVVLMNGMGAPLVVLEQIVLQLCGSYFNFFGSIKLPAVVQYASRIAKFVVDHSDTNGAVTLPSPALRSRMFYL